MFVNDHLSKNILVYDLNGNYKRSFGSKEGIRYTQIGNFDRDNLICFDGYSAFDDVKRNIFWIISKQDGSVTKEIQTPYKEKKTTILLLNDAGRTISYLARNQQLIPYHDNWILVKPSSDTIYSYSPNHNMTPFIVRTPSVQSSMEPEVFLFPGVLTNRFYFMQTVKKEYDFAMQTEFPRTDLVFDRQEKAIFEYVVYNDDFSTKKTVNLGHELAVLTPLNNEIAFLQKLEASELVEAYEDGKLKGKLKEIAMGLNEESNPVIMLAKYKKE